MSKDMNSVALTGRLVKDQETKTTQTGTPICRFVIANNYSKKTGDKWEEEANFFDCVLIGTTATKLGTYLTKGRQVAIEGQMRQQRWESNGEKKSKIEVIVDELILLTAPAENKPAQAPAPVQPELPPGPEDFDDSDIPF